jgi:hypothetical protein
MTQTQPDPNAAGTTPSAPWTPTQRGVHWTETASRPSGPMPPAGMPPVAAQGYAWPAPPRRTGMRWSWIVLGVVAAIVAVAIIGTVAQKTSKMTINGSAVVYGMSSLMAPGTACTSPAMTGKPVSIFGSNGDLVGTSSLTGSGVAVNQWNTYSGGYADACQYSFTLTDVTASDDYYRVTLGADISNSVGFSKEQLQASGANITMGH